MRLRSQRALNTSLNLPSPSRALASSEWRSLRMRMVGMTRTKMRIRTRRLNAENLGEGEDSWVS